MTRRRTARQPALQNLRIVRIVKHQQPTPIRAILQPMPGLPHALGL